MQALLILFLFSFWNIMGDKITSETKQAMDFKALGKTDYI